jgi:hypothetical protein
MAIIASLRRRNPLTFAILQSSTTIQTSGDLHAHPWSAMLHTVQETTIHLARFIGQYTELNLNTRCTQPRQTLPCHQRVRVFNGNHYARYTGGDERISARRCTTVMTTRLERDIHCGSAYIHTLLLGMMQRMRLRMGEACGLGMSLGQDIALAHDDAAHPGIGGRAIERLGGLRQGSAHAIGIVENFHGNGQYEFTPF